MTEQDAIDTRIQTYYGEIFDEQVRLTTRSPQGPLEFARTQEIVRAHLPSGRVLDIGGGAGVHAAALQRDGYEVELIDPVPRHVEQARAGRVRARVGDARELPFPDASFDGVLLLGPLYHLTWRNHRMQALREAARVVRPGGFVFAAGLSRFIALGMATLGRQVPVPYPADWVALAAHGTPAPGMRFPAGHFHTAEELGEEVSAVGMHVLDVVGVEGPAGALLESLARADADLVEASMKVARAAASVPGVRDMSAHLIAVARVGADAYGVSIADGGEDAAMNGDHQRETQSNQSVPHESHVPEIEQDETIAPRPEEEVADLLRAEPDTRDHSHDGENA